MIDKVKKYWWIWMILIMIAGAWFIFDAQQSTIPAMESTPVPATPTSKAVVATRPAIVPTLTPTVVVTKTLPSAVPPPVSGEANPSFLGIDLTQVIVGILGAMTIVAVLVGFLGWVGRTLAPVVDGFARLIGAFSTITGWPSVVAMGLMFMFGLFGLQAVLGAFSPFSFARGVEQDAAMLLMGIIGELGVFACVIPFVAAIFLAKIVWKQK